MRTSSFFLLRIGSTLNPKSVFTDTRVDGLSKTESFERISLRRNLISWKLQLNSHPIDEIGYNVLFVRVYLFIHYSNFYLSRASLSKIIGEFKNFIAIYNLTRISFESSKDIYSILTRLLSI